MSNEILFSETQKFKQWWLWLILLGINLLFIFGLFKQVIGKQQFGDHPITDTGLLLVTGFSFALTILFLTFKLQTQIKSDGIYVRFFPFHLTFRHYTWQSLIKCFVRKYAPIPEFGGWGLRLGLFGGGKAFNVSGNIGLQLEFTDENRLLIGTNKPKELTEALNNIGQLKQ